MAVFSVLDLAPVPEGALAADAFRNTLSLARHAETLGFHRFWLAEHHNMPGIASAATSVVMAYVAAKTSMIRIGSGGVMLPNHAPLVIAEQFGTLESLFPGRIDLGIGRAPGGDQLTARALRRNLGSSVEAFPQDVIELQAYFRPEEPGQALRAVPGAGLELPLYLLGSSDFSARLAAALGLPFAFASHFAPASLELALRLYRENFKPSRQLKQPYVMIGVNVFAAEDDATARFLFSSLQQQFLSLFRGTPGKLPPPTEGIDAKMAPAEARQLAKMTRFSAVGSAASIRQQLIKMLADTQADEVIATSQMFDPHARNQSFSILAEVRDSL